MIALSEHCEQAVFPALVEPPMPENATIQEQFTAFHKANPWVLQAYIYQLRQARLRGLKHVGIGFLTELLRWHYAAQTKDPSSEFKINNNYRSRYARLILDAYPEFQGFMTIRHLKSP